MSASAWQDLVDPLRLQAWMDGQGLGSGPITSAIRLTGGTQNLLMRFQRDAASYVLRCPSAGARVEIHHGFRREVRLLKALADTAVPHARLLAHCDDDGVLGAPFYLMAPVDGFTATPAPLPEPYASDPHWRQRMGLSMVDALLRLGEVDVAAVGLGDFGKPAGFLARQMPRWLQHLERCHEHSGWPGPQALPDVRRIADWLEARLPAKSTTGLIHGDYHFGNVMFRHDAPALAAVIDWELATLGDPLLDLGWLVATWPDAEGCGAGTIRIQPSAGLPSTAALIEHYRARSERDLGDIGWYIVLAQFKLGIMLEASYARSCAGKASAATGAQHHASARRLLGQALATIEMT